MSISRMTAKMAGASLQAMSLTTGTVLLRFVALGCILLRCFAKRRILFRYLAVQLHALLYIAFD